MAIRQGDSKAASVATAIRPLGLFFVAIIVFGITTTLHGLSPLATYGLGAVFILLLAVVMFLIPGGMVAAELATTWQRDGGVYVWVSEAFGTHAGFMATWLQWAQNIIFWTVILTSSAAMLALGFGWEGGAENKLFAVAIVLGSIWLTTGLTLIGLRSTGWTGTVGSIAGTIVPGVALIAFAIVFLVQGNDSNMSFDVSRLVPDFSEPGNITFAISTIMIFAGIELMGTRVREIRNPGRTYPRATWLAITMTVVLLVPTTLAIAVLVPRHELSITAGIVQAMTTVFDTVWQLGWVPAVFAFALLLDAIGEISGWMAGTPIAMATAAEDGYLPKKVTVQKRGAAPVMLLSQAVIGSLVSILFIVEPTVAGTFWVLSALLVQLYVMMYMMLFASAWKLRYTHPEAERPFKVPGGKVGIAIVCSIGLFFALAVFAVGFIPPATLGLSALQYIGVLVVALAVALGAAALLIWRQSRMRPSDRSGKASAGERAVSPAESPKKSGVD